MPTTKIYKNVGKDDVFVIGVGDIPAGEQVSVTTDYHQPVVLANYPTLREITADDYVADEAAPANVPVSTQPKPPEAPAL